MDLSDSDIRQALEAAGQKVTDDAIRSFRAMIAAADESLKSIKSSYSIEKHRDIKINDPMSAADFR